MKISTWKDSTGTFVSAITSIGTYYPIGPLGSYRLSASMASAGQTAKLEVVTLTGENKGLLGISVSGTASSFAISTPGNVAILNSDIGIKVSAISGTLNLLMDDGRGIVIKNGYAEASLVEILSATKIPTGIRARPFDIAGCTLEMGTDGKWYGDLGTMPKAAADALYASGALANLATGATYRDTSGTQYNYSAGAGWLGTVKRWSIPTTRNPKAFSVMGTPPTITTSGANPQSAGQFWAATASDASTALSVGGSISLFKGAYYQQASTGYPGYSYLVPKTFTQGYPASYSTFTLGWGFEHTGSKFTLLYGAQGGFITLKVNDEWVSLTVPVVPPNDGSVNFLTVDFGSVDRRRIDVLTYRSSFGGIYTDATDSITPALRRGPRTVVMSDSFGEGTGSEIVGPNSWIDTFAEYMGWDDVITSAVGSTGVIAGTLPKVNYQGRAVRDVATIGAELIFIKLSINDSRETPSALVSALDNLISIIREAGSEADIWVGSTTSNGGHGRLTHNQILQNTAVKSFCVDNGYVFLDSINQPKISTATSPATTLTAPVLLNATSLTTAIKLVPGTNYSFDDGSCFFCRSNAGATATTSPILVAQPSGARVAQVGPTIFTGLGKIGGTTGWGSADVCISSDGVHPVTRGHKQIGLVDADLAIGSR